MNYRLVPIVICAAFGCQDFAVYAVMDEHGGNHGSYCTWHADGCKAHLEQLDANGLNKGEDTDEIERRR